jgi:flavodoxin
MKILVVYDSQYGNTEKVAKAIGEGLGKEIKVLLVKDVKLNELEGVDMLVAGSPTQGGQAKAGMKEFLDGIPRGKLKNVKVAVFDTRFLESEQNIALKMLMRTIGYAAPKMAKTLTGKGGKLVTPVEGFIVKEKEGPLGIGELERAKEWGKELLKK